MDASLRPGAEVETVLGSFPFFDVVLFRLDLKVLLLDVEPQAVIDAHVLV